MNARRGGTVLIGKAINSLYACATATDVAERPFASRCYCRLAVVLTVRTQKERKVNPRPRKLVKTVRNKRPDVLINKSTNEFSLQTTSQTFQGSPQLNGMAKASRFETDPTAKNAVIEQHTRSNIWPNG